jgi:hypothetical protein
MFISTMYHSMIIVELVLSSHASVWQQLQYYHIARLSKHSLTGFEPSSHTFMINVISVELLAKMIRSKR